MAIFYLLVLFLFIIGVVSSKSKSNDLSPNTRRIAVANAKKSICALQLDDDGWNDTEFDVYIRQLELTERCVSALDTHQMHWSGETINKDDKSIFRYLDSIDDKVKYNNIWSYCSKKDIVIWDAALGQIYQLSIDDRERNFTADAHLGYAILSEGCGAEDHSLTLVRQIDPPLFDTFTAAVSLSPHVALGLIRLREYLWEVNKLDDIIFGEDEAPKKSPWSLRNFILSPGGSIASTYFRQFVDTNFYESYALMLISYASDFSFYFEFLTFVTGQKDARETARTSFFNRNGIAIVWTLRLLVLNYKVIYFMYFVPYWDIIYPTLLQTSLLVYSLWTLYGSIMMFKLALCVLRVSRSVVDYHCEAAVKSEVSRLTRDENLLFSKKDWREDYDEAKNIDSGSFGTTSLGTRKNGGGIVAIKIIKSEEKQEQISNDELFSKIIKSIFFSLDEAEITECFNHAKKKLKQIDDDHMLKFKHEILALKVIASFNPKHESLLEIFGAHVGKENVLVMQLGIPLLIGRNGWNQQLELFTDRALDPVVRMKRKLSIVQTFFSAIATLHKYGIAHRDIKTRNLAVRHDNPDIALVIDMGSLRLPGQTADSENLVRDVNTLRYSPPETLADYSEQYIDLVMKAVKNDDRYDGIEDLYDSEGNEYLRVCHEIYTTNQANGKNKGKYSSKDAKIARAVAQNYKGSFSDVWACALTAIQILADRPFEIDFKDIEGRIPFVFLDEKFPTPPQSHKDYQHWWRSEESNFSLYPYFIACGTDWSLDHADRMLRVFDCWNNKLDPSLVELFRQMLHPDYDKRATMAHAANHEYFRTNKIGEFREPANKDDNYFNSNNHNHNHYNNNNNTNNNINESIASSCTGTGVGLPPPIPFIPNHRLTRLRDYIESIKAEARRDGTVYNKLSVDDGNKLVENLLQHFKTLSGAYLQEIDATQWQSLFESGGKISLKDTLPGLDPSLIFELLDTNKNNLIDRCELLLGLCYILTFYASIETRLCLLFHAFDKDENGLMSVGEFSDMLKAFNSDLNPQASRVLFTRLKANSAKFQISLEDFIDGISKDTSLKRLFDI